MGEESQRLLSEAAVDALRSSWERQRIWSIAAEGLRQRIASARRYALALAIGTAILAVAASQVGAMQPPWSGGGRWLNFLAAVTAGSAAWFAVAPSSPTSAPGPRPDPSLRVSRVTSISVFQGGLPYLGSDSAYVLTHRSHRLLEEAHQEDPGLERVTLGVSSDHRPLPAAYDLSSYIDRRLNDQIERYYRPRARS